MLLIRESYLLVYFTDFIIVTKDQLHCTAARRPHDFLHCSDDANVWDVLRCLEEILMKNTVPLNLLLRILFLHSIFYKQSAREAGFERLLNAARMKCILALNKGNGGELM